MADLINDTHIRSLTTLSTPAQIVQELPRSNTVSGLIRSTRQAVHNVLGGQDDRLVVVIGPCSIHDPVAAREYAKRLIVMRDRLADDLEIIMRVYFEKPRTTVGWKRLINDPHLDGSFKVEEGLRLTRRLLNEINMMGMPAGVEFLDTISPQYIADLVSWGAIGARTTESQIHRELASGLSCPIGFKNATNGDVQIALDAIVAASRPHHFLAVTKDGQAAIAETTGNGDCHLILRGGLEPNFDAKNVDEAARRSAKSGVKPQIMIDASHANSRKKPENQPAVIADIAAQLAAGDRRIMGVMVESNLVFGRQDLKPGVPLTYGQSITDGCIDWATSVTVLEDLAKAVQARRKVSAGTSAKELA